MRPLGLFKSEPGYERTKELSIYISASARGAGLGKALLGDVLDRRQQHHQIISAIDASNEGSLKLHDGFGFERVGTLPRAGFVASDPAFWDKGLSMISGFIDELEAMEG